MSKPTSPDEGESAVLDLLAEIEREGGANARRLAARAVAKGKESFVRKMGHTMVKHVIGIDGSLHRMTSELEKPVLDGAALTRFVEELREYRGRVNTLMSRARDVVYVGEPHHCEEPLAPIVEEARVRAATRLGGRAARLAFTSNVSGSFAMHADYEALVQALEELVMNAAEAYDASAPRLEVAVTARTTRMDRGRHAIAIVVADHGRGMLEESLEWLFVPFTTGKPVGTGLGIVLAQKMVEEVHGGTLAIASKRGRGARVRIVLPRKQRGVQKRRRLTIDEIFRQPRV